MRIGQINKLNAVYEINVKPIKVCIEETDESESIFMKIAGLLEPKERRIHLE